MKYQLFKASYTDEAGNRRESDTFHMRFRDHLNRRQKLATSPRERDAHHTAGKVMELVRCRRTGEHVGDKLRKWLEAQSEKLVRRLVEMEVIDPLVASTDTPLSEHLDGKFDADGKLIEPGFKQALEARGNTANHVKVTTDRVRRILDGCSFTFWRDIIRPGAADQVSVILGGRRDKGQITGQTFNYYVRDLKSFCRWLAKQSKAPAVAMAALEAVKNADTDSESRRPLSVNEMRLLLSAAAVGPAIQGLYGSERALLYRFAFETGMRPGQIRALLVKDFDLDADPPTVTTHAKYVKRRRTHTQTLRPELATELRKQFASRMPTAAAIKMPSKYHLADMLRRDLAAARQTWIDAAATDVDRQQRQRSDFLADENNKGERAVFYSTRHGHGTALANAGVPEKDIAASMHHASRKTTQRYIHADRESVARAIGAMPDLSYPKQVASGTDDRPLANPWPTAATSMDSGGQISGVSLQSQVAVSSADTSKTSVNPQLGLLAELADAMDSKSIARKGVSVRLR